MHANLVRRAFPALLLCMLCGASAIVGASDDSNPPRKPWPAWDGVESTEQYAARVNLPPTKTLDLGNDVKLEFVLIPPGTFTMGTLPAEEPDQETFVSKINSGKTLLILGVAILLIIGCVVGWIALVDKKRPQISLAMLMFVICAASLCVFGVTQWRTAVEERTNAMNAYRIQHARSAAAGDSEAPAHQVTLTRPYYMSRYLVTTEQYGLVLDQNPGPLEDRDMPYVSGNWESAEHYCQVLREQTGAVTRLPTEAEWEFACRAGTQSLYYSGDTEEDLRRVGWYEGNSTTPPSLPISGGPTNMVVIQTDGAHPVGKLEPNSFGLYDMHGNVWQACSDFWGPYQFGEFTNPTGPKHSRSHVLRGGAWNSPPAFCRSAMRFNSGSHSIFSTIGIRVVLEAPPTEK